MDANLKMLQVDFVDLMLVHYPVSMDGNNTGGKASRQLTWKAMEAFAKAGKARAIGVSHFCKHHMEDVLEISTVTPAVNQVGVLTGIQ
jgi:diketogulonate reductase-like aldo/keto reductase